MATILLPNALLRPGNRIYHRPAHSKPCTLLSNPLQFKGHKQSFNPHRHSTTTTTIVAARQPSSHTPHAPTLINTLIKGITAISFSIAAFFLIPSRTAHAARTGGRMGGSSFHSFSPHSYTSSSSSFHRYNNNNMHRHSIGLGTMIGTPTYIAAGNNNARGLRMSSFFLSPFGFGYGMYGGGGGGLLSLLFWGSMAVFLIQAFQRSRGIGGGGGGYDDDIGYASSASMERFAVAKVQVGLLGSARELQTDLERIASKADTTSPQGLQYILQETVLSLMRNPQYCVYGYAKSGSEKGLSRAESRFNQLSMEERSKFQKETLVNVAGRSKRARLSGVNSSEVGGLGESKELIVVTLLVAASCPLKLKQVGNFGALKEDLGILGSLGANDILAVEVLWTPEEEDDFFTQEDLAADYPLLAPL